MTYDFGSNPTHSVGFGTTGQVSSSLSVYFKHKHAHFRAFTFNVLVKQVVLFAFNIAGRTFVKKT